MIARWRAGVRNVRYPNVFMMLFLCKKCSKEIEQMGLKLIGKQLIEPTHECNRCDGVRIVK